MPRSSRLETHDHSTCGFMAWCRKSGAQVAGKLENSTAIVAADGEKSARIDLKVLPAFDKCPNEGKDEQLRSLLQHSFDELKLRYDGHVARFDCLTLCLIRCSHTHRKCFDFYNMHKVSPWTLLPLHSGRGNAKRFAAAAAANTTTKKQKRARASRPGGAKKKKGDWSREHEQAISHYSRGKLLENACDFDGARPQGDRNRPGEWPRPLQPGRACSSRTRRTTAVRSSTTAGRGRSTRRSMPTPTASWQGSRGPPGAYRLEHKSAAICMRPRSRPVPPASLHWAYTATPGGDHLHKALCGTSNTEW